MAEQREGGIRTKETKHLTLSHIQVEAFHRKDLAEYFCEILSMDHIASLLIWSKDRVRPFDYAQGFGLSQRKNDYHAHNRKDTDDSFDGQR